MDNTIVWFEIPVKDLKRAIAFYAKVMGVEIQEMPMGDVKMGLFPHTPGNVSGALVEGQGNKPSETGPLIYINGGDDLAKPLSRVEKAGGKVLADKMSIGQHGYIAFFRDTEGNRIGIHSMK